MGKSLLEAAYKFALEVARVSSNDVRAIILFGSVSKGLSEESSDIDLMIVFETGASLTDEVIAPVQKILRRIEHDEHVAVQTIYTNMTFANLDPYFVQKALSEGTVLYGRPPQLTVKDFPVRPYTLIGFSLDSLSERNREMSLKELYGELENGRRKGGLVSQVKGKQIAENVLMVSTSHIGRIEALLDRFGVPYSEQIGWLCAA
jgi:predicted nucleotidyltransferase